MTDSYERKVEQIKGLLHENKYDEGKVEIRKLCCIHLTPTGQELGLNEVAHIFLYKNMKGPCLDTLGEKAGNATGEGRKVWDTGSNGSLDRLYKCALTGDYCIATRRDFHSSDIPEGDYFFRYVEIDSQKRCPAFKNSLEDKCKEVKENESHD